MFFILVYPDNEYEIGEEPESTGNWRRRKRRKESRNGWLSSRKKIEDVISDIEAVRDRANINNVST